MRKGGKGIRTALLIILAMFVIIIGMIYVIFDSDLLLSNSNYLGELVKIKEKEENPKDYYTVLTDKVFNSGTTFHYIKSEGTLTEMSTGILYIIPGNLITIDDGNFVTKAYYDGYCPILLGDTVKLYGFVYHTSNKDGVKTIYMKVDIVERGTTQDEGS